MRARMARRSGWPCQIRSGSSRTGRKVTEGGPVFSKPGGSGGSGMVSWSSSMMSAYASVRPHRVDSSA
jgi:hypothetical protein